MSKELEPLPRRPALSDYVRDSIRAYIRENDLQPGAPIPSEKELSQRLGVGRNSVREAVKALESLGVLETRQGSGIYVRDFTLDPLLEELQFQLIRTPQEAREYHEVRMVLELGMIHEVLGRITDEELDRLDQVLERMRACAERGEPYPELDREFHRRLFAPIGNGTLLKLLSVFWHVYSRALEAAHEGNASMQIYQDHADILAAARSRDVAAARSAIKRHYDSALERLRLRDGAVVNIGGDGGEA